MANVRNSLTAKPRCGRCVCPVPREDNLKISGTVATAHQVQGIVPEKLVPVVGFCGHNAWSTEKFPIRSGEVLSIQPNL